jgi:hypothetical protein
MTPGSPLDTVTLPTTPIAATRTWLNAVDAAEEQCQCTGACGKSHRAHPAARCPEHRVTLGARLYLARDGRVYCRACFSPIERAAARATADRAALANAERYPQDDLFALLSEAGEK